MLIVALVLNLTLSWMNRMGLLEVEGENNGDDDICIGDSANKSENHPD